MPRNGKGGCPGCISVIQVGLSSFRMSIVPRRFSLSDQTVQILRQGIETARWAAELPSEAKLCRELQISRVTLRRALERLAAERLITPGGRGRHHRIEAGKAARPQPSGTTLRVLTPYPLHAMGSVHHVVLDSLMERLGPLGYRVEFEHRPLLFKRHQPAELERLDALPDTAGWLLFFTTEAMQRWFAGSRRPCLLVGRAYDGVALPSIYSDTLASVRHAAGLLYQRGHRDVVYLMAKFTSLNDQLGAEAFVEATRRLGGRGRVVAHAPEVAPLRAELDLLLAARPRPTAFFSNCPEHCLTVLCHLQNAGLRVPADIAILSGWDNEFLRYSVPSFAHYRVDGSELGRKAAALLAELLRDGPGKTRALRVLPKFVPGETLG